MSSEEACRSSPLNTTLRTTRRARGMRPSGRREGRSCGHAEVERAGSGGTHDANTCVIGSSNPVLSILLHQMVRTTNPLGFSLPASCKSEGHSLPHAPRRQLDFLGNSFTTTHQHHSVSGANSSLRKKTSVSKGGARRCSDGAGCRTHRLNVRRNSIMASKGRCPAAPETGSRLSKRSSLLGTSHQ